MSDIKQDEQDIERLLNAAGQRQNPPSEVRARVYACALETWQALPQEPQHLAPRKRRLGGQYLALAASAFIAVAALWFAQGPNPVSTVADVVFAQGSYQVDGVPAVAQTSSILPNAHIQTSAKSLVSVQMASGAIVTLDQNTDVSVEQPDMLYLRHGRLYVDAGGAAQQLVVQTPHSKIVDVGTQFEVVVDAQVDELMVAVREGQVDVSGSGHEFSALAEHGMGEVVRMRGTVLLMRSSVETTHERWDWRRAGREPYALANSTVYDYLRWMARDTGHELEFSSRAVASMSKIEILLGKGSKRSSDDTKIADALATTRFVLDESAPGRWRVAFRS